MKYSKLTKVLKNKINYVFNIPTNTDGIIVENGIAFELIGNVKVALSLNVNHTFDSGFHSGSVR